MKQESDNNRERGGTALLCREGENYAVIKLIPFRKIKNVGAPSPGASSAATNGRRRLSISRPFLDVVLPCVVASLFHQPHDICPFRLSETGILFFFSFFRRDTYVCTHINVYIVIKIQTGEKGRHRSQTVGDVCESDRRIYFSDGTKNICIKWLEYEVRCFGFFSHDLNQKLWNEFSKRIVVYIGSFL